MAYKDKQQGVKYRNEYSKNNYDRINILTKKGFKAQVKQAADASGENISAYIVNAVLTRMQSEGIDPDSDPET